ncbi:MAG: hypothetical protein GYA21_04095 [Myxococcales bacterium]|nr:hypothetical protein [Myxococcales bacterium]
MRWTETASVSVFAVAALVLWSCQEYSGGGDPCQTIADCNAGKTCGHLIDCVNNQCDSAKMVDVPCPQACERDEDCVRASSDCCPCELGGPEVAVATANLTQFNEERDQRCANVDPQCAGYNACTDRPPVCREGVCALLGEGCRCAEGWSPVCVASVPGMPMGVPWTFPDPCQASCAGLQSFYPGRCDCQRECAVADPVCAANGVSYVCGAAEAECSGQAVRYPGECSPACDACEALARPWRAVCGADFTTYPDACFADCQEQPFWHYGECGSGEGERCGGIVARPCPDDSLYCVNLRPGCMDCPGVCLTPGSCYENAHCDLQPLEPGQCKGSFQCLDHACTWVCLP